MYPIARLINSIIKGDKEKKIKIVRNLGYTNISKGLRRLDQLITGNLNHKELIKRLPGALGIEKSVVITAVQETRKQIEIEQEGKGRELFKPHIFINHELKRPRQITIVAFLGAERWKHIPLPEEIVTWTEIDQILHVRSIIVEHQIKNRDKGSPFGEITGYFYRKSYDQSIEFSVSGDVINPNLGRIPEVSASLKVGKKMITGGLFTENEEDLDF